MLVGAPIVASRVGGIPSLMKDGEEGLLVPRGDTAALAAALGRLLDDHDAAVRFAAAARATALRRNDPEHIVARMLEVYAAVMAHAGAERTAGAAPDAATAAMEVPA
jgi:glycosyltransferase involved in cell wall biosynthesis